jgi:hypothetical protein
MKVLRMGNKKNIIVGLMALAMLCVWSVNGTTEIAPTNIVVDFDLTSIDSGVQKGDNIVMNLVIKKKGE